MSLTYTLVKATKREDMVKEVQARLNDGWELQGGICMDGVGMGGREYYQAMILRKK